MAGARASRPGLRDAAYTKMQFPEGGRCMAAGSRLSGTSCKIFHPMGPKEIPDGRGPRFAVGLLEIPDGRGRASR
jgi:hypothetical protein